MLAGVLGRLKNLGLLAAALVAWWYVSVHVLDKTTRALLPPPTQVLVAAWELVQSGDLWRHVRDSVKRELVAFLWATSSIPLGIAMGWWKAVEDQVDPVIELLRPVPPLAWIPLSILWFGIGDVQNQFIIFLGCFFPILINTVQAVKGIEPNLIRASRALGANELRVLWRVVLPAALPQIIIGIRVGLGVGWMALVAAELVGANSGLGFLISDARTVLRTDYVIVGMAVIGLIGLAIDSTIRFVARRLLPWSQELAR
jgi:ABC-type nitrate/sulfonate/bicarbonate transport system permease component